MRGGRVAIALATVVATAGLGCARRPVLYPNRTLEENGRAAAEREIDRCLALAREVADGGAREGAAAGAAAGAIGGAAGRGAAVGAASGAAWSGVSALVRGLFRSGEPDSIERSYVDRCLRERGYEPIGWR
jgi:hypothetical protein